MKWCIVGHGALASLWAHHLSAAGETVTIVTRVGQAPSDAARWSNQMVGQAPPDTAQCPTAKFTLQTNNQLQTRDMAITPWSKLNYQQLHQTHILIMVKAWQLKAAVQDLATHLQRTNAQPAAVILSHNGLGAAEKALQQHSDWPLYDLVTTHGAWRKTPLHVVHAGLGQSYLGPRQPPHASACSSPPVWFPALANALPTISWEAQILTRRWHKLAINCAINPLASLAGEPNGVLKALHYHRDIEAICAEIAGLASIVLGSGVLDKGQLVAQVHQVIEATAENNCSMLQDIQNGNPTEIAYLNGFVAKLGAEFDLPTPVNQRLYQAIETLSAN